MANYGYGYGTFTSQPQPQQQYAAASFGYAAYAPTAYAQPQIPVATAGYAGYPATAGFVPAQKTTQTAYGYGVTAVPKTTSYTGTTYQKQNNAYVAAAASSNNYSVPTTSQKSAAITPATSAHQNAYEKVVYNAASSFLSEQSQSSKSSGQKTEKPTFKLNGQGQGKTWYKNSGPPKVQQLHYCDVCKISCAGLQTYKEHLNGQKHKKKAAMTTTETKKLAPGTYKCELCDVVCTGKDAYNAHVKGASHQRTLKLHQKLGKAIPDVKVLEKKEGEEASGSDAPGEGEIIGETYVEDMKNDDGKVVGYNCTLCECRFSDIVAKTAHVKGRRHRLAYKKKIDPKIKIDFKGDRHRGRDHRGGGGGANEMAWRQREHEQMRWEQQLRFREEELRRWEHDEYMKRAREDKYWTKPDLNRVNELEHYEFDRKEKYLGEPQGGKFPRQGPPPQLPDDRIVMAKHKEIYPGEVELKQVHSIVASTEKALKLVSDTLEEAKKAEELACQEGKEPPPEPLMKQGQSRILKGVMRVGALAKGLLLKGQLAVDLVVLCADKPTYTLLEKIGKLVPEKLNEVAPNEKFDVVISIQECAIIITSKEAENKRTVKVSLTSPTMREGDEEEKKTAEEKEEKAGESSQPSVDPADILDKDKALHALAALRHAKWFQARANHLASCVITIRVMRDLCNRVVAFKALSNWAIEVLCEKSLACSFQPLGPGDAFRRVMEAIASGIFLPGGCGLLDPCEKEKSDAASNMAAQERENITSAAQLALRLQSFGQLHKVLGVDALTANPLRPKRRAEENGGNESSSSKLAKKE